MVLYFTIQYARQLASHNLAAVERTPSAPAATSYAAAFESRFADVPGAKMRPVERSPASVGGQTDAIGRALATWLANHH